MPANGDRIRVLIVEDRPQDAESLVHELERDGYELEWTRVETEEDFLAGLDPPPDLVISDYELPGFSGPRALELMRSAELEAPFIVVSETVGEEAVVDLLRRGANDYLLKDRLGRLPTAVNNALQEQRARRAAAEAESEAAEAAARYQALFQNMGDAVAHCRMIVDGSGAPSDFVFLEVNDRFAESTGLHDVEGKRATELAPSARESNPEVFEICGEVAFGGGPRRFETRTGALGWLDVSVHSPQPGHFVAVMSNVTDRKAAEADRLESESNKRANEAKTEFLSRMSHELRTLLNVILGFGQLLELQDLGRENDDSVKQIMIAARQLLELVEDVLQISRIEAGTVDTSTVPVPVREMIVSVAELLEPLAAQADVTLTVNEVSPAMLARANTRGLRHALLNLTSNAIKYNGPSGKVTVSARELDGRVLIEVSDTGSGIPPQDLERVWVPFERLGAESSGIPGTGLGLAVSKELVEAMGGTITATSEVGKGSRFTIDLQWADSPGEP